MTRLASKKATTHAAGQRQSPHDNLQLSQLPPRGLFRVGELNVNGSNPKHGDDDRLFFTPWHVPS